MPLSWMEPGKVLGIRLRPSIHNLGKTVLTHLTGLVQGWQLVCTML